MFVNFMKCLFFLIITTLLCAACEQRVETPAQPTEKTIEKNTTVVQPPAEKKEEHTTIVNPAPKAEEKTTTTTTTSGQ